MFILFFIIFYINYYQSLAINIKLNKYLVQDYSRWMSYLNNELLLSDIIIPGTHLSANSYLGPITGNKYKTQNYTIEEQLINGIRYFDIVACEWSLNDLAICYNSYFTKYSYDMFQNILIKFLNNNPLETIIVKITQYNVHNDYYVKYNLTFIDVLNLLIQKYNNYYWNANLWQNNNFIPQLKDLHKKIYIIFDNNNTNIYNNETIENCEYEIIINKFYNNIIYQLTKNTNKLLITYNSIAQYGNSSCKYIYTSNITNPILTLYIKNTNVKGIIVYDFVTSDISNIIILKNKLNPNIKNEYILTFTILSFFIVCILLMYHHKILLIFLVSCTNTTVHIFALYYYSNTVYRDFNTTISSKKCAIIWITLIILMLFINLCILWSHRCIEKNIYIYLLSVDKMIKSCILVLFIMYCCCCYILRIPYNKNTKKINILHHVSLIILISVNISLCFFDIYYVFTYNNLFVIPIFTILCAIISFINTIIIINHVINYKKYILCETEYYLFYSLHFIKFK